MSGHKLDKFDSGNLQGGINVKTSNISIEFQYSPETKNVSQGINEGLGPRYGLAPIPFQTCYVAAEEPTTVQRPMVQEADRSYGIYPLPWRDFSNSFSPPTYTAYVYPITQNLVPVSTVYKCIQVPVGSRSDNVIQDIAAGVYFGFLAGTGEMLSQQQSHMFFNSGAQNGLSGYDEFLKLFQIIDSDYTVDGEKLTTKPAIATQRISGPNVPTPWICGVRAAGNLVGNGSKPQEVTYYGGTTVRYGIPSSFNTQNYTDKNRVVNFYDLNTAGLGYQYTYNVNESLLYDSKQIYLKTYLQSERKNLDQTKLPNATNSYNRLDGVTPAFNTMGWQLLNDPQHYIDSSYFAVLIATGNNALISMVQDWIYSVEKVPEAYVDPTNIAITPTSRATIDAAGPGNTPYTENGTTRPSCFWFWPSYEDNVPLPVSSGLRTGSVHVALGAAGSGILRANTLYEFTYSVYDKMYNYETNVGDPVKFLTDEDDFVALTILRDKTDDGTDPPTGVLSQCYMANGGLTRPVLPSELNFGKTATIGGNNVGRYYFNLLQYRFYYRVAGTFEWLPALGVDAAKYWYYPNFDILYACQGPIAALPGGQPGGFNDYSPLPNDRYFDVKFFQDRAFWMSQRNLCWSYRKNVFAYAVRNQAACPDGIFKGVTIHTYYGQRESESTSRLLIHTDKAIYNGRFTGQPYESPIVVSPDVIESFPLDGSDFLVEYWTSFTSFSSRTAIVADSILYYWGPTGIFMDEGGGGQPKRISQPLEPDLFDLYDANLTNEFFAVYQEKTQEIIWFYRRKGTAGGTAADLMPTPFIMLNIRRGAYFYGEVPGVVEWGESIRIENMINVRPVGGNRVILGVRNSVDNDAKIMPFFFDSRCRAGDTQLTTANMMVTSIATVAGEPTWRRLNIAAGVGVTPVLGSGIAVGDFISLNQIRDYFGGYPDFTTADDIVDIIAVVKAVDDVSVPQTIDIELPTELQSLTYAFTPGSPDSRNYAPVYHSRPNNAGKGLNGIEYVLETNHWAPAGVNYDGYWLFTHLVFKYGEVPTSATLSYNFKYRTPISGPFIGNTFQFVDNSDNNCQAYIAHRVGKQNNQGQGIKLRIDGIYIGGSWTLQYLSCHARQTGNPDFLKQFQPRDLGVV